VLAVSFCVNNVDQALRILKKKMQREGVFREMKRRKAYEKPSERRARENARDLFQLPNVGTISARFGWAKEGQT
jgi:ribosomal protein S21